MRGFSLVELMIAITIMGILGSLAIPSYQDYVMRAKVTNMLSMAQLTKLAVTEGLITGNTPPMDKIANKDVIKEISVKDNIISIIGDSEKLGIHKDKTLKLTLTPDTEYTGMIVWKCKIDPEDFKKYAPSECRG